MAKVSNRTAKKKRAAKRTMTERELHEERRYGFFWYDWLWRILRPLLVFACSFVLVCGIIYTGWTKVDEMFFAPVDKDNTEPVGVQVTSGSSLSTVARQLEEAGLIHNHSVFKYMADFMGKGQSIQSGNYQFTRAMSATQLLDRLIAGDGLPTTTKITIIPGWTIEDIARYLVAQKVLVSADDFLSMCQSGERFAGYYFVDDVIKSANADKRRYALEGYLSPNTYEIYMSAGPESIIKKLLSQTEAAFSSTYDERAQEIGLTMDEVLTLASMIEKEAKTADFAKVSAVFHNRLKTGMSLGSDVTVKYISGSEKMSLSSGDLALASPYNTYLIKGLPPGPICNPSMDAVIAALYPDEQFVAQKYLYFCSTDPNSGELHFSRTLGEHEAAVAMYRPLWEEYDSKRGLN